LSEIRRIRERSKILVAFGDCAATGNVTAMRNVFPLQDLLQQVYRDSPDPAGAIPGGEIVPRLLERVRPIHEVVHVDYFLVGCPPPADAIWQFLTALLAGKAPSEPRRFG
jgi:NAD-reducing hydrogenase small subunit